MDSDADDWGLLSVADVLGDFTQTPKNVDPESTTPNELVFPLICSESTLAAGECCNHLVSFLKREGAKRTNYMEEMHKARSLKLKHSLLASQHIRKRVSNAVESFTSTIQASEQCSSAFKTLTLLGATMDTEGNSYCNALLDSISFVDWGAASSCSCIEVLQALSMHVCEQQCSTDTRLRVLSTKLHLALRSGRLSALVSCLLLDQASEKFSKPFRPTFAKARAETYESTIDSFLTRQCTLPCSLGAAKANCFFSKDILSVVYGGGSVARFESMGMMGTRLLRRDTLTVPVSKGESIFQCRNNAVITVQPTYAWHYTVRQYEVNEAGARSRHECTRSALVVVRPSGLSVRSSRCYFSMHDDTMACLLCSETSNVPRRHCYVASTSLDALFNATDSITSTPLPLCAAENTLWRDATDYSTDKALHFTRSTTIQVGRVTLKDHFHPFCVELWVYPRNITESQTVIAFGDKGVDEILIEMEPSGDGVLWRGGARTPQLGASFASFSSPGKLSSSERWWHVALNFTGTTWELWLDNQFVSRRPCLVSPEPIKSAKCTLGKSFVGFLAEVRVWNQMRTAAELYRDSRRPLNGNEPGLCGYYPLNEHHGDVIVDYSASKQHALLGHGVANWCAISSCPVPQPEEPRLIPDFLSLAHLEDPSQLLFALTPHYYCVGNVAEGDALTIFQYSREDRVLACQIRVEVPVNKWDLQGISFNETKGSLLCWAASKESETEQPPASLQQPSISQPQQLVLWDMHNQGPIPVCSRREYADLWKCGKDLLLQSSLCAQRFLNTERYLADQLSWNTTIPTLVIDPAPELIPSLLRLAHKGLSASGDVEEELVQNVAVLLHANLFFRYENNPTELLVEVGEPYADAKALLEAVEDGARAGGSGLPRDAIADLAFASFVPGSGLLRMCCRCFLTEQKRIAFMKSVAGRSRTPGEEKLFLCLIDYYGTLQACDDVSAAPERAQQLYNALILEATYQVDRCLRERDFAPLQRTSRCLEVFQEMLFARVVAEEKVSESGESQKKSIATAATSTSVVSEHQQQRGGDKAEAIAASLSPSEDTRWKRGQRKSIVGLPDVSELTSLVITYCKTVLRACDKTIDAVVKAMRKRPKMEEALAQCLEFSPVGALLPSFTVSLPFLPAVVLSACSVPMQACRDSLLSLADVMTDRPKWVSDLGISFTFSLCLVGCALLDVNSVGNSGGSAIVASDATPLTRAIGTTTSPDTTMASPPGASGGLEQRFVNLLRGGLRRPGSERDIIIKNLQQGLGPISRLFEEMQKSGVTALRVIRDEELKRMERHVMAAACALLVPTRDMKEATKATLEPAFRYVLQLRSWVLARRQESRGCVVQVEKRAQFLAQFEPCSKLGGSVEGSAVPTTSRTPKDTSSQYKWRKLFRSWKAMRVLKTRISAQEEGDSSTVGADMMALLQSDTPHVELERVVTWRTQKARYRLAGLLLLKQLADEARINAALASLVLPVMAKTLCGWHYADGVDCCSSEDIFRLHGAFFQLLEVALSKYLTEKSSGRGRGPWAGLFTALMTPNFRIIDFRKMRSEMALAFRALWGCSGSSDTRWASIQLRVNGSLPVSLRGTKLVSGICAPSLVVGESGLTLKAVRGRGTCVAPCTWHATKRRKQYAYYFEVCVVDLLPGGSCSVGVGSLDYSLSRMPGWDANSYALQSDEGILFTGSTTGRITGFNYGAGDIVGCGWNLEKREVFWTKNGRLIASTSVTQEELSPLIGFDGKGTAKVNFGDEPFLYTHLIFSTSETSSSSAEVGEPGGVANDAWDAFRVFSMRAAMCLREACGRNETSPESIKELSASVGICLDALADEIDAVSAQLRDVPQYAKMLLSHTCTLAQLLTYVPAGTISVHAAPLSSSLERSTQAALQHPSSAVRRDLLGLLLLAWCNVTHLVPPPMSSAGLLLPPEITVQSPLSRIKRGSSPVPRGGSASTTVSTTSLTAGGASGSGCAGVSLSGGIAGPHAFLATLLHLASFLCLSVRGARPLSSSLRRLSVQSCGGPGTWGECDEAPAVALALLQRINGAASYGTSSASAAAGDPSSAVSFGASSVSSSHAWAGALHEWLLWALGRPSGGKDALLALAVLGGGARLAVAGDHVAVRRTRHSTSTGTLVSFSLEEEICVVIEGADPEPRKCNTLPLRLVDLVIGDTEVSTDADSATTAVRGNYFPVHGNTRHMAQAQAVVALSLRVLGGVSTTLGSSVESLSLYAQLLAVLRAAVRVHVVDFPPLLLNSLLLLSDSPEMSGSRTNGTPVDLARLRVEKVFSEYCGSAAMHRSTSYTGGGGGGGSSSGSAAAARGGGGGGQRQRGAIASGGRISRGNSARAQLPLPRVLVPDLAGASTDGAQDAFYLGGVLSEVEDEDGDEEDVSLDDQLSLLDDRLGGDEIDVADEEEGEEEEEDEDEEDGDLDEESDFDEFDYGEEGGMMNDTLGRSLSSYNDGFYDSHLAMYEEGYGGGFRTHCPARSRDVTGFYDGLRFTSGLSCLRLVSSRPAGYTFTIDVHVRLAPQLSSAHVPQILFAQPAALLSSSSASPSGALSLVLRVHGGIAQFGYVPRGREASILASGDLSFLCTCSLAASATTNTKAANEGWVRLSAQQSSTALLLARDGIVQEVRPSPSATLTAALLHEDMWVGGVLRGAEIIGAFRGEMQRIRMFDVQLRAIMLERLLNLGSPSMDVYAEAHTTVLLGATRDTFTNLSRSRVSVPLDVVLEGRTGADAGIVFLESAMVGDDLAGRGGGGSHHGSASRCLPEVDLSRNTEDVDIFMVDTTTLATHAGSSLSVWRRSKQQSMEQLLAVYKWCWRELACVHSVAILTEALCISVSGNATGADTSDTSAASIDSVREAVDLVAGVLTRRSVRAAVLSSDEQLYKNVEGVLVGAMQRSLQRTREPETLCDQQQRKLAAMVIDESLRCLLQVAQSEQGVRFFESQHPFRTTSKSVMEICVPDASAYQIFFDPRTRSSNLLLTFAADKAITNIVAQAPGFALSSFSVRLPRLYVDTRSDATNLPWGFKISVVFQYEPQLRALRLFRSVVSTALVAAAANMGNNRAALSFLSSSTCLELLSSCVLVNTGRTRRLALSCISDLLMLFPAQPMATFAALPELRRMAERQFRKRLGGHTLHSRFIQLTAEACVAYRDAIHCWPLLKRHSGDNVMAAEGKSDDLGTDEARELDEFQQRRLEQRSLYRQREGGERIAIQKLSGQQYLHVEWNAERLCVVHTEGVGGGSITAGTPLISGRWYFEVRIGGVGDVFIGVVPQKQQQLFQQQQQHRIRTLSRDRGAFTPVAFNGFTGVKLGAAAAGDSDTDQDGNGEGGGREMRQQRRGSRTLRHSWHAKDFVGVIIDVPARTCTYLINGVDVGLTVGFLNGSDDDAASAAANAPGDQDLPQHSTSPISHRTGGSFLPYFSLEAGESMAINFGGVHFDSEVPRGCLPLDPTNLMLGTLLPYNQMRAFHDLSAHVLTGGTHPKPPYFYEEADPFAESTERTGPAHVSLHAVEGVQVNLLEVKNTGSEFCTVCADCAVRGGAWYYEVTLRTQGLMQLGWTVAGGTASIGDSAGSWGIDLFRRLKWHNGKPEAVNAPRRWSVGDVIGCAIDLAAREMTFFLNGRHITGSALTNWTFNNLPSGVDFVPAITLRAGNCVSFNFGSASFKYKPEGFNALGVSDSWSERMDTFYANESPATTLQRQQALRVLWADIGSISSVSSICSNQNEQFASYSATTAAVDTYCQDTGKNYSQITEAMLRQYVKTKLAASPSGNALDEEASLAQAWTQLSTLLAIARVSQAALPLLPISTKDSSISTRLLLAVRPLLFRTLRHGIVEGVLKETMVRTEHFRLSINRARARIQPRTFKSSVFGQTFEMVADQHPRMFRTNRRFWNTVFLGEGAEDVGGPFREHVSEMCRELMSTTSGLRLFVPTGNQVHNTGTHRDAFVPAAGACSEQDLAAFEFIGRLMGGCLRSEEPLGLFFPPLVWRYLCCYPITEADLDDFDTLCVKGIHAFRSISDSADSRDAFEDVFDTELFVTRLSDDTVRELIPGGATTRLTFERSAEYAEALLHTRLHEFDVQVNKMREGMLAVVPELTLLLLTPAELELRVCGKPDYAVDELRKSAIHEGLTSEDRRVQLLWRALEEATPTQRRLFLRFVSGRDRLPIKLRIIPLNAQGDPDVSLPRAATCFFAIELPDYSSLEVMKRKLYYSIENCADMDTDFNARVMDETEGPHLVVGMDEGRPEEISAGVLPDD